MKKKKKTCTHSIHDLNQTNQHQIDKKKTTELIVLTMMEHDEITIKKIKTKQRVTVAARQAR